MTSPTLLFFFNIFSRFFFNIHFSKIRSVRTTQACMYCRGVGIYYGDIEIYCKDMLKNLPTLEVNAQYFRFVKSLGCGCLNIEKTQLFSSAFLTDKSRSKTSLSLNVQKKTSKRTRTCTVVFPSRFHPFRTMFMGITPGLGHISNARPRQQNYIGKVYLAGLVFYPSGFDGCIKRSPPVE